MLHLALSILGKKVMKELYGLLPASTASDVNIDPPNGRVFILLNVDVSLQRAGYVAIYKGNRLDTWLPAKKIIQSWSDDTVISFTDLFMIATEQDRIKIRVSNSDTANDSTVYINYEYIDVSVDEFEALKEKMKDLTGVMA